jgi:lactoylglutathione lyase
VGLSARASKALGCGTDEGTFHGGVYHASSSRTCWRTSLISTKRSVRHGSCSRESRPIVERSAADLEVDDVNGWSEQAKKIGAITLFVEDIAAAKRFYLEVFDLPVYFEDENSAVFRFGDTLINLLDIGQADDLIEPAAVASRDAGSRMQFTMAVEDLNSVCEELTRRGVTLLNGPMDRPWGIRTASFTDPGGHIWEIAQDLP